MVLRKPRPIHKVSSAIIQAESAGMMDGLQTECGRVDFYRYPQTDSVVTCKQCLATISTQARSN